ncbi:hypothetical protein SAMN05216391_10964 [Lachnospiraceae bacterium KHCPX20]|nr:hypothetical protein SAMN05216391_10964 [Lachnospiraceae bacterium KHCPX20]
MISLRNFAIPKDITQNQSYQVIHTILDKILKEDQNKDLQQHIISTANLVYEYCKKYLSASYNLSNIYIAALYYNIYKSTIEIEANNTLDIDQQIELKIYQAKQETNEQIRQNVSSEITCYLFEKQYEDIRQIYYMCNILDNLLCIRTETGDLLPLSTILDLFTKTPMENTDIVKNMIDLIVENIYNEAEEFQVEFSSQEEMKAFERLPEDIRNHIIEASDYSIADGQMTDVIWLKKTGAQLVLFDSQKASYRFYDVSKNLLYLPQD